MPGSLAPPRGHQLTEVMCRVTEVRGDIFLNYYCMLWYACAVHCFSACEGYPVILDDLSIMRCSFLHEWESKLPSWTTSHLFDSLMHFYFCKLYASKLNKFNQWYLNLPFFPPDIPDDEAQYWTGKLEQINTMTIHDEVKSNLRLLFLSIISLNMLYINQCICQYYGKIHNLVLVWMLICSLLLVVPSSGQHPEPLSSIRSLPVLWVQL